MAVRMGTQQHNQFPLTLTRLYPQPTDALVNSGRAAHHFGGTVGFFSRPDRPCQARLTTFATTTCLLGLRVSSHHWPVVPIMPTSICEYIGAALGSKPRFLNSATRMP